MRHAAGMTTIHANTPSQSRTGQDARAASAATHAGRKHTGAGALFKWL